MRARVILALGTAVLGLSGCMGDPLPRQSLDFPQAPFPEWTARDADYRFFPGDRMRIELRNAPELSSDQTVAPDGRITLNGLGSVMAANHSVTELQAQVESVYSKELIDPTLIITPTEFGSQKIFVGGEVKSPGVFELPGEIDPLQAILMAGGWTDEGRATHVIVLRRSPGGKLLTRVVDVKRGLANQALYDIGPMRRFDVIYVTRKSISDENLFVKQFVRDALPIDFSLFYDVAKF